MRTEFSFSYQQKTFSFNPETLRFTTQEAPPSPLEGIWDRADTAAAAAKQMVKGFNFITLNVAHDCNMACPYCFAKQGHYNGPREMMDATIAYQSVDWLLRVSGDRKDCYIRFLGGEPLLNLPVMRSTMKYARSRGADTGKEIHFSVNTNGTICTPEVLEMFEEYQVTTSISMDGTREAHNRFRIFNSGRGTYDLVAANLKKFLAHDPYIFVNATLTAENLDIYEYAMHFRDLGVRLMRFAMVGTSIPEIAVRQEESLRRIFDNYDRLAAAYLGDLQRGEVWYLADFYKYFENLRGLSKRLNRCSAGTSYVNVDLTGNVHLCHRFTADKTQRVGHISGDAPAIPDSIKRMNQLTHISSSVPSGVTIADGKRSLALPVLPNGGVPKPMFVHRHLDGEPLIRQDCSSAGAINVCSLCDIRYLCGGSCFHDGEILFGDLHGGPDGFKCDVDRHLAKIGIWLLDEIYRQDTSVFATLDDLHYHSIQHTD